MKVKEAIAKLQSIQNGIEKIGGIPNNSNILLRCCDAQLDFITTDIEFSIDDNNDIEIIIMAGAKPY